MEECGRIPRLTPSAPKIIAMSGDERTLPRDVRFSMMWLAAAVPARYVHVDH